MSIILADLNLSVTPSEATELCIHHLRLAFGLYLSSEGRLPEENRKNLLAEVERQVESRGAGPWEIAAITAFINAAVESDEGPEPEVISNDQTRS